METSVFIARILGPCLLIVGVSMMLNRSFFLKVMEDFCKNAALMFFAGMFPLIFGLVVVLYHNVWVANWRVIITIYGWGGIIKGIWLIVFPNTISKFMQAYQKNSGLLVIHSILAFVFGAALTIFGYFAG